LLLQDIRYALRTVGRNPLFMAIAILCLSLGIGVNAMIFSVVDGVLIQPFPYVDPDRIVVLNETFHRGGVDEAGVSYPDLRDWKERNTVFTTIAALQYRSLTISDGGDPERYLGAAISWDLFALLGTQAAIGRTFNAEDDRPGAEPVVLLGDEVWQRRYQADPAVVGRRALINARPHTIVGVMPKNFEFPENQKLWVPLAPFAHSDGRAVRNLMTFARLEPGVTLERGRSELGAIATRLAAEYPDTSDGWTAIVRPLRAEFIPEDVTLVISTMMGAVTLVLLIACANVANLLLARASVRQREMSIRAAIGAGRARIVRQLLTEAVVLGLLSAPVGLALAYIGVRWLDSAMPPDDIPYYIHFAIDGRAMTYTIAVSIVTGILFGLAPAYQATRVNLHESLKEGRGTGGTGQRARLRNALVVAEVALALVLLVGASLFVRSFVSLKHKSAGFDTSPLMTMRFYMAGDAYATDESKALRAADLIGRVESLPGVKAAFASNLVPLAGGGGGGTVAVEGRSFPKGEAPGVGFVGVTPHFFRTLNVPILRGRDVTDGEGSERRPVAIVNQAMATRLWPDQDPLGRRFKVDGFGNPPDWFTVIGVCADFFHGQLDTTRPPFPSAYVPYPWQPTPNTGLVIRVLDGEPAQIIGAVRAAIRAADSNVPLFNVRTMEEVRQLGFWQFGLFGEMFSIFGLIALLLAAVGVYGVLSYAVSQRTQEIGVRVALGADRSAVLRLVVGHGLKLAGAGIALGLAAALGVTRVIRTLLFSVTPTDPLSFGGVAIFLTLVAALASYFPARRATAVDPLVALRSE
jgi:putative ABC transport system permease protein